MCDTVDRFDRPQLCMRSHTVTMQTKFTDPVAIAAACQRLGLEIPTFGKAKLFSEELEGVIVKLPEWSYPIVINPTSGEVKFDNYHGSWGDQKHIDAFMQAYAVEKAKLEARRKGMPCSEKVLSDGRVELTIHDRRV